MIRKGDRVRIRPEWQDAGDDSFEWYAVDDEDKGRVSISPRLGQVFRPVQTVAVTMLCAS